MITLLFLICFLLARKMFIIYVLNESQIIAVYSNYSRINGMAFPVLTVEMKCVQHQLFGDTVRLCVEEIRYFDVLICSF